MVIAGIRLWFSELVSGKVTPSLGTSTTECLEGMQDQMGVGGGVIICAYEEGWNGLAAWFCLLL